MQPGTMLQYFHWYYPNDGSLWKKLQSDAPALTEMGITAVWLPPAFKAHAGGMSVGYDIYDLYDLGEFDQKGTVATKYGTKAEYLAGIKAAQDAGIQVYADVVLNHLAGADEKETCMAVKVNPDNRLEYISEPYEIEAFTKFTYQGRGKQYDNFEWNASCFTGTDYDARLQESGIFLFLKENEAAWEEMIDNEKGNYDYLMYADVEFRNEAVRTHLKNWGSWYQQTTGINGVRLDAVKHIAPYFYNEWLDHMRAKHGEDFFAVGEYWAPGNLPILLQYIEATEGRMRLFDSALQHRLHEASISGSNYDLTTILQDTLMQAMPQLAVTVVDNHDTQPLQALEAPVEPWFKPIAYALILLRAEGYPCVFYPDLFGATYIDKDREGNDREIILPVCEALPALLRARKTLAHGEQRDYFDHANCIGWTRAGDADHQGSGCAVLLSNGDAGEKEMEIGIQFAGQTFYNLLRAEDPAITIQENGWGRFTCGPGTVAVWTLQATS